VSHLHGVSSHLPAPPQLVERPAADEGEIAEIGRCWGRPRGHFEFSLQISTPTRDRAFVIRISLDPVYAASLRHARPTAISAHSPNAPTTMRRCLLNDFGMLVYWCRKRLDPARLDRTEEQ